MAKRIAISSVAIVCIFIAFVLVPKREFRISVFPLRPGESVFAYDDQADGGSSVSGLSVSDSTLDFACTLGGDSSRNAWCGIIWDLSADSANKKFRYENWSLVDSIGLDVYSESEGEIIVKVWTFDPDVTKRDSLHTFRQMLKEVSLKKGRNRITLAFDEFYVPDFWFAQTGAAKELVQRHKEHVARFEITPGWKAKRGVPMKFRFVSVFAKGTGTIELAAFLAISVCIVIVALGFFKKKR